MRNLMNDRGGAIAVYAAIATTLGIGAGAMAIDAGRIAVLRTQMQNRADAAAMAAAAQLDGNPGAQARATAAAMNASTATTGILGGTKTLSVNSVRFYTQITPTLVAATGDSDSVYAVVKMRPQTISSMFLPVLAAVGTENATASETINASATAATAPFVCSAPPLMVCDPAESNPALDPRLAVNAGRQMFLKLQGSNATWAPGNFGLLSTPNGDIGAAAVGAALADVTPPGCYSGNVSTAPGSKTNQVMNGVNARFTSPSTTLAPDIMTYPRDADIIAGTATVQGDGIWDQSGYWSANHGGAAVPAAISGGSRFQTYLYEVGVPFGANGKQTIYPIPAAGLPTGFTQVTPPGANIPASGKPSAANVASNGAMRRVVQAAILECVADNVHGHGTYASHGYVQVFLTEPAGSAPTATILGEIIDTLSSSSLDYHLNVQLIN